MVGSIREISWNLLKSLEISWNLLKSLEISLTLLMKGSVPFRVILGRLGALGSVLGPLPICLRFSLHSWGLKSNATQHQSYNGACFVCMLCWYLLAIKRETIWLWYQNQHRASASMQKQGHRDLRNHAQHSPTTQGQGNFKARSIKWACKRNGTLLDVISPPHPPQPQSRPHPPSSLTYQQAPLKVKWTSSSLARSKSAS